MSLGYDMSNSDALRWHIRSRDFLVAIKSGDLADTFQKYHPGVTLMWLGSFVQQASFSIQTQILRVNSPMTFGNAEFYPVLDGSVRTLLVFILGGLFLLQMLLIKDIFDAKTTYLYGIFLSIEPYLIGIDRWFHLTSLENYLVFSAFLLLLYWSKHGAQLYRYKYFSAFLLSLSILTKISALMSVPVILLVLYNANKSKFISNASTYFAFVLLGVFALFPALWVQPGFVLTSIYNAVVGAVGDDLRVQSVDGVVNTAYYFCVALLKISPVLLLLGVYSLKKSFESKNQNSLHKLVFIYLGVYLLFLTLSGEKIERYVIAIILPLVLAVSICIANLSYRYLKPLLTLQLVYFLIVTWVYFPLYSGYYTGFKYGYSLASDLGIYANSGEYFRDAALYLNTKTRNTNTYVPANIDTFSVYYKGNYSQIDFDYMLHYGDIPTCEIKFGPKGYNILSICTKSQLSL